MYEELIRRLREEPLDSNKASLPIMDLCIDAATAIENLSQWMQDEVCVNADCPLCADYCPVVDVPGVCRFEDRG